MIRRNLGMVMVMSALVALFVLAVVLARAQHKLPLLALDLTEHLFGIVLAVFVFERMLAWREERRWLAAKKWLYMILLETIDDLMKQLLPETVAHQESEADGKVAVYEVSGERIHFGEAVAHSPLRLLVGPGERDLQSSIAWHARELGPPQYVDLAKEALAEAREQVRDTFGSSARLMEADITAMLMSFEQAALAAIGHLESAASIRDQKVGEVGDAAHRDDGPSAKRRITEADHELSFASSIIVESVIESAIKPKAWLEDQIHGREGRSLFRRR